VPFFLDFWQHSCSDIACQGERQGKELDQDECESRSQSDLRPFVLMLVVTSAIGLWQAVRATREEGNARHSEIETRAVLTFFRDKILAAGRLQGQNGGLGRDVSLREALDAAEPGIAADFAEKPTVEAAIRDTLGASYLYLGEPTLAIRQHERARALRSLARGLTMPRR
jgi:hypothetical protein